MTVIKGLILIPCNSSTNFEYEEAFSIPELNNFAVVSQKDILILDGLEKGQLIQFGNVAKIKSALRNQGRLAPFALFLRLETLQLTLLKLFEQNILSICSKQLVTPVNLTRKK